MNNAMNKGMNQLMNQGINQTFEKVMQKVEDMNQFIETNLGDNLDKKLNKNTLIIEGFNSYIDPYVEKVFFGNYTPIKGQYLAFNNLSVSFQYDTSSTQNILPNNNVNAYPVILTITDNNTNGQIIYNVKNINNYQILKNAIILDISSQTTNITSSTDNSNLQQLLIILGITVPTKLVMTVLQDTSQIGTVRYTYKLLNINMDTIMIMQKN
jgi:hypothetical protein